MSWFTRFTHISPLTSSPTITRVHVFLQCSLSSHTLFYAHQFKGTPYKHNLGENKSLGAQSSQGTFITQGQLCNMTFTSDLCTNPLIPHRPTPCLQSISSTHGLHNPPRQHTYFTNRLHHIRMATRGSQGQHSKSKEDPALSESSTLLRTDPTACPFTSTAHTILSMLPPRCRHIPLLHPQHAAPLTYILVFLNNCS